MSRPFSPLQRPLLLPALLVFAFKACGQEGGTNKLPSLTDFVTLDISPASVPGDDGWEAVIEPVKCCAECPGACHACHA